jgi:long-chain acyl-CoA synthetase
LGDIVDHRERVLAYLPLAHIFEFVFENLVLYIGGTLGYGSTRTLSDTSVRGCAGDIREFRPTILVGVPQVWESVKKGLLTRVEQAGAISRTLFWAGYHLKSFLVDRGLPGAGIIDNIVFKAAREATGGRLRFCFNGSSALSEDTLKFISIVITPMVNGYGLTETTAMGAILDPQAYASDAHGEPPSCIEVKLCSIPELSYFADRNPPQGEILIRGPAVMKGYYNNPEETAKALDEEGWFYTGDIGEWDKNGHLRVIDRKKNLVKMLGGEYVALEKVWDSLAQRYSSYN